MPGDFIITVHMLGKCDKIARSNSFLKRLEDIQRVAAENKDYYFTASLIAYVIKVTMFERAAAVTMWYSTIRDSMIIP